MPTRSTYLAATINGFAITRMFSARCTYGWKRSFPDATILVPLAPQNVSAWAATTAYGITAYVKPTVRNGHVYTATQAGTSGTVQPLWPTTNGVTVVDGTVIWTESGVDAVYNDPVTISMGAGTNNILRFNGVFRKFNYSLFPRAVGLSCYGNLIRAHEYENIEGTVQYGGLSLLDLTGTATPTDQAVVQAVLTKAGVTYTTANVAGTGVTWGSRSTIQNYVYVWRAAMMPGANIVATGYGGLGQKALDYIQEWDKVSAVYVDASHAAGFYRTYETVNGIFRSLIGGRPRNVNDFTFSEGIDIEQNAQGTREYPIANAAYVTGADFGLANANPVRNVNGSTFVGQSSNPFQPSTRPVPYQFSSPFIEWALEADGGAGMNCERVGNALLQDLNRETVTASFRTPRDDLVTPGKTMLVRGPGGQPDRLGIGEPLWIDEVTTGVNENGMFYQDIMGTGGGLPDSFTPSPPG
jgi:hypothetical protein